MAGQGGRGGGGGGTGELMNYCNFLTGSFCWGSAVEAEVGSGSQAWFTGHMSVFCTDL